MERPQDSESIWQPLSSEERAWLEVVRTQRENLALRQQLLAQDEHRLQASIALRLGAAADGLEVDLANGRVRCVARLPTVNAS